MSPWLAAPVILCLLGQRPASGGSELTTVTIRFLDESGRPLDGVGAVWGHPHELSTLTALATPQTRGDAEGYLRFQIPRNQLRPPTLLAVAAGRACWVTPVRPPSNHILHAGNEVHLDLGAIRLPQSVELKGRIVNKDGSPLRARVTVTDLLAADAVWNTVRFEARGETEDDGTFRLPGVCPFAVRAMVQAPGHYRRVIPWLDPTKPLEVALEASGYVRGRVAAPPSVAARWRVMLQSENQSDDGQLLPLGDADSFELTVERRGFMRVLVDDGSSTVAVSELLTAPRDNVLIETPAADQPPLLVRARSKDTQRELGPIHGSVSWGDDRTNVSFRANRIGSDEHGILRLPPPRQPTRGTVAVAAVGHAPRVVTDVVWPQPKGEELWVDLESESVLAGRIVEAGSDKPVAGAIVMIHQESGGPAWARWTAADGSFRIGDGRPAVRWTAADGSFRVGELAAGSYRVAVLPSNLSGRQAALSLALGVAERNESLRLTLPPGVEMRGRVRSTRAALDLVLLPYEDSPRTLMWEAVRLAPRLAADGAFCFEHRGTLPQRLWLFDPGQPRHGTQRYLNLGRVEPPTGESMELQLPIAGRVRVQGRVQTKLDVPPGRLVVCLTPPHHDVRSPEHAAQIADDDKWCLVGPDGRYELDCVPGDWLLTCHDVVTGMELLRLEPSWRAGEDVVQDLELKMATIDVTLPPAGYELEIDDQAQLGTPFPSISFGSRRLETGWKVVVEASTPEMTLFVPEGQRTLTLRSRFKADASSSGKALAITEVAAQAGQRHAVKIALKSR